MLLEVHSDLYADDHAIMYEGAGEHAQQHEEQRQINLP